MINQVLDALFQINGAGGSGVFGSLISGLFGGGFNPTSNGFSSMLGLSGGGYTGNGGTYQPKGVVHGGEFVFSKAAVQRAGVGNLEAMHKSLKGYAGGGLVGAWATNERGNEMATLSGVSIGAPRLKIPSINRKEIA